MRRATVVAVLLASVVLVAPAGAQGPVISIDSGLTERVWLESSRPRTDELSFTWHPSLSVLEAELFLFGNCVRFDVSGTPVGRNKVVFKNFVLTGVDSGNEVPAARIAEQLSQGEQIEQAVWLLTEAARAQFTEDSAIAISGQIRVDKRVDRFDILRCELGVVEVQDFFGAEQAPAQGFDGELPAVRGTDLPEILRSRPRP